MRRMVALLVAASDLLRGPGISAAQEMTLSVAIGTLPE